MGALPEAEVRTFLSNHVEAGDSEIAGDPALEQAMDLFEQGDIKGSRAQLQQLQATDPANVSVLLALGQVCVADSDIDTAESCYNALSDDDKDSVAARRLSATIALSREMAGDEKSLDQWQSQLAGNADDSEARYKVAIHNAAAGNMEQGLDELLTLMQKDPEYNDGAARKKLLNLFDVLGSDPLAGQYRRKMFALLH